jgi:hypothetical protein
LLDRSAFLKVGNKLMGHGQASWVRWRYDTLQTARGQGEVWQLSGYLDKILCN